MLPDLYPVKTKINDDAKYNKSMYRQRTQKAWEHKRCTAAGPVSSSTAPGTSPSTARRTAALRVR